MKITAFRQKINTPFFVLKLVLYVFCALSVKNSHAQDANLGSFIFGIPKEAGKTKYTNYIFYFKILFNENTRLVVLDEVQLKHAPNFDSSRKSESAVNGYEEEIKITGTAINRETNSFRIGLASGEILTIEWQGKVDPMQWKYSITTVLFDEVFLDFKGGWVGSDIFDTIHDKSLASKTCNKVLRPYLH